MIIRTMRVRWVFCTIAKTIPGRLTRTLSKNDYLTSGLKRHAVVHEYVAIDGMIFHGLCACEQTACNWMAEESRLKMCWIALTFPPHFASASTVGSPMVLVRGMTSRNWPR